MCVKEQTGWAGRIEGVTQKMRSLKFQSRWENQGWGHGVYNWGWVEDVIQINDQKYRKAGMLGGGQSNGRAEVSDPAADVVKGGGGDCGWVHSNHKMEQG